MSLETRKFFKSTRSQRILKLATSRPIDSRTSVTEKYEFDENTDDPWHRYKLWRNKKNAEKEIKDLTEKKMATGSTKSSSSLVSGSSTRTSLQSFRRPTSSDSDSSEYSNSISETTSSNENANIANTDIMKELHTASTSGQICTENAEVMLDIEEQENQNDQSIASRQIRKPNTILQGDYSIELSNRKVRVWDKKDRCLFCNKDVTNFSRHIYRNHSDEESVKKILSFPKNHPNRRIMINSFRKDGNFSIYVEKTIRPVQRPSTSTSGNLNFLPCKFCRGLYKKTSLKKHLKSCGMRNENIKSGKRYCSEALTMLAFEESKKPYLNRLRLKTEVFGSMHADRIALEGMQDPIACQYAEDYLKQHKRPHIKNLVSNKIRELGRLLIQLKDEFGLKSLLESLQPQHFDKVVTAARRISGYNETSKSFKAPSLALHFRTNLVQVCATAETMILKKNPMLKVNDQSKTLKDLKYFKSLVASNWKFEMGSLALKDLTEKHSTTPQKLPLTKDLILFNKYCHEIAERAANDLKSDMNNLKSFKQLSETVLVITISINRKRVGDVQYTKIESYNANRAESDCLDMLTESEKQITKSFKRILTIGKGSRAVPLLFPKRIQNYIEMLLRIRKETTLVPEENPYLFALAGSPSRWIDGPSTLRKYAKLCGAENPDTITSSRLRKQIATVLQILNLSEVEMEQIAKFMGHTKKTHEEFYRLPQELFQTSKVAKLLLMTMEKGISRDEQGKTIDQIDFELGTWDGNDRIDENQDTSAVATNEFSEEVRDDINVSGVDEISTVREEIIVDKEKTQKVRGTWNNDQKKIMLMYFKKHIRNKIAPKKNECLEFREKYSKEFISKSWLQIKTFVYNTYRMN